jgi:hypothetical protein
LGVLVIILHLLSGDFSIHSLLTAFVSLAIGFALLKRVYFIVEENKLILNALYGPFKKTYNFSSIHDLIVENNKVYLKKREGKKKIRITKWVADRNDWDIFIRKILY